MRYSTHKVRLGGCKQGVERVDTENRIAVHVHVSSYAIDRKRPKSEAMFPNIGQRMVPDTILVKKSGGTTNLDSGL